MKILIVYATKYGFTGKCASLLAEKLNADVTLVNINTDFSDDINQYDKIIIGGAIYAGSLSKKLNKFCEDNRESLLKKPLGLFITGLVKGEKNMEQLNNVFPNEFTRAAISKHCFGGALDFSKINFFEKIIMKIITKTGDDISNLDESEINKMAGELSNR